MQKKSRRRVLFVTAALGFVLLYWLAVRWAYPPFTPPVLPVPNGYDELLQAAKMLAPRTGFYREMDEKKLATIVEQNKPALALAREALQKECVVSINWSANRAWFNNVHMERAGKLKGLAHAFAAAARQAKNNGQMGEAVRCGMDALQLAQATAPGGLMIDRMVAGGVHYTAMYSLRDQVEQLSRDECLQLQKKLQASPLQLDPLDEVFRREEVFFRQINGRLQTLMMTGVLRSQRQQTLTAIQESDKLHVALDTLLQTHLALRAFHLDKKHFPEKLDELVPDYLDEVPLDSFTGKPMIYRPQADGYLLYSVGRNGVDDQGVETTTGLKGDLLLEVID
ncbi:MAG: hypothetical protein GXP26_01755 [Planctomycetes bacterium]|nr:hypothetical protein [Planctomycetota bacterium]